MARIFRLFLASGFLALALATAPALAEPVQKRKPFEIETGDFRPLSAPQAADANGGEADADALRALREQRQKELQAANSVNPVSDDFGASAPSGQIPEYLHAILTHPAAQRFLLFTADPEVQKAAMTIAQNPSRGDLIYWQLSWFLLIFVLKFWLARRSGKPWVKMVNVAWSSALYLCGAVVAIPAFVLGDSYLQFLKGMLRMFGIG